MACVDGNGGKAEGTVERDSPQALCSVDRLSPREVAGQPSPTWPILTGVSCGERAPQATCRHSLAHRSLTGHLLGGGEAGAGLGGPGLKVPVA